MRQGQFTCIVLLAVLVGVGCADRYTSKASTDRFESLRESWERKTDAVGKPCPEFSYKDMNGKTVSLSDYKGKALLLDVWSMT